LSRLIIRPKGEQATPRQRQRKAAEKIIETDDLLSRILQPAARALHDKRKRADLGFKEQERLIDQQNVVNHGRRMMIIKRRRAISRLAKAAVSTGARFGGVNTRLTSFASI
jgi:hypothetical protein